MSQGNTRLLDTITRIYKNADESVIGIHSIFITENRVANPHPDLLDGYQDLQDRRNRTGEIKSSFDTFNLVMGQSRVVAQIQMIGKYDEFVMDDADTDIARVVYAGDSEGGVNDLIIGLEDFLYYIGDTI